MITELEYTKTIIYLNRFKNASIYGLSSPGQQSIRCAGERSIPGDLASGMTKYCWQEALPNKALKAKQDQWLHQLPPSNLESISLKKHFCVAVP